MPPLVGTPDGGPGHDERAVPVRVGHTGEGRRPPVLGLVQPEPHPASGARGVTVPVTPRLDGHHGDWPSAPARHAPQAPRPAPPPPSRAPPPPAPPLWPGPTRRQRAGARGVCSAPSTASVPWRGQGWRLLPHDQTNSLIGDRRVTPAPDPTPPLPRPLHDRASAHRPPAPPPLRSSALHPPRSGSPHMNTIDKHAVDEAIAQAFKEVRTAMNSHNERSLRMYTEALTALLELRRAITDAAASRG
ncbi:hypothetical protein SFR_3388 [Streptomyces sp. FR-008]|nr:hypothetical protein SFR_3388 [Streptomyces sp. FR-008]